MVVELRRFGIAIDDSAGVPLDQTVTGSFLLLAARLIVEGVRPVSLLSLLKHPLMRANLEMDEVRRRARLLERSCLRGPALLDGFRPIIGLIDDRRRRFGEDRQEEREQLAGLRDWLESLSTAASSFTALAAEGDAPFGALLEAHLAFVEALAAIDGSAEALWAKEAGEAAALLFRELVEAQEPEDRIPPAAYPALLGQLMAARPVRPEAPRPSQALHLGAAGGAPAAGGSHHPRRAERRGLAEAPGARRLAQSQHAQQPGAAALGKARRAGGPRLRPGGGRRRGGAFALGEGSGRQSNRAVALARAPEGLSRGPGQGRGAESHQRRSELAGLGDRPRFARWGRQPRAATDAAPAGSRAAAQTVGKRHRPLDDQSLRSLCQAAFST